MNIFIFDLDPVVNARYYCDRHNIKILLELNQMLCSVHYFADTPKENIPYKLSYANHPCNKWMRESLSNYCFSLDLAYALCKEYTYRYGKIHKCERKVMPFLYRNIPSRSIPYVGLTPFVQAMPDKYKNENVVTAYRSYFNGEKRHLFSWTKRDVPGWVTLQRS